MEQKLFRQPFFEVSKRPRSSGLQEECGRQVRARGGRVDGDKYALILHLTNMELKSIE